MAFKLISGNWVDMIIGVNDVGPEKMRVYIMRMIGKARPEIFRVLSMSKHTCTNSSGNNYEHTSL